VALGQEQETFSRAYDLEQAESKTNTARLGQRLQRS